jgi:hypothetical protein
MTATLCPATLSRSRPRAGHLRQIRTAVAVTGRIREDDLDATARADLMDLYRRWRGDRDI